MPLKDPAKRKAYSALYYKKHRVRIAADSLAYRKRKAASLRAYDRARYLADPEKKKAAAKRYYDANKGRHLASGRRWYAKNIEKMRAYNREHYAANRTSRLQKARAWARMNRDLRAAANAERRARERKTVLTKTEKLQVKQFYRLARDLTSIVGKPYHVDHIKPLAKGGLHHPDNLQVLRGEDNLRKGARWPAN